MHRFPPGLEPGFGGLGPHKIMSQAQCQKAGLGNGPSKIPKPTQAHTWAWLGLDFFGLGLAGPGA